MDALNACPFARDLSRANGVIEMTARPERFPGDLRSRGEMAGISSNLQ
jgi:hypothetical protein